MTSSLFVFITSEAKTAPLGRAAGHTKAKALINTQAILLKIHQPSSAIKLPECAKSSVKSSVKYTPMSDHIKKAK